VRVPHENVGWLKTPQVNLRDGVLALHRAARVVFADRFDTFSGTRHSHRPSAGGWLR